MTQQRLLCLHCNEPSTVDVDSPPNGCPKCGVHATPANLDDTVTLTITQHELRILTIWASNWADHVKTMPRCEEGPKVIAGIRDRLGRYTSAALSLGQEIADLRVTFGEVHVYRDGDDTVEEPTP